jgi:hypothetical protein
MNGVILRLDIVALAAAITKNELVALNEKLYIAALVDRDSSTRWASCLAVQFDVACALPWFSSREAVPAFIFHWHRGCYG